MDENFYKSNSGDAQEVREPAAEYVIEEQLQQVNLEVLKGEVGLSKMDKQQSKFFNEISLKASENGKTRLMYNEAEQLLDVLKKELLTCDSFDIVVSFIRTSGLSLLVSTLDQLQQAGIKGRIITTTYLNITEPSAMETLLQYPNIETKIYQPQSSVDSFHAKSYIFYRKNDVDSIILGSSNISKAALKNGEEWNLRTYEKKSDSVVETGQLRFEHLWRHDNIVCLDEAYVMGYKEYCQIKDGKSTYRASFNNSQTLGSGELRPNSMQDEALSNIQKSMDNGHTRGLAIAATGTGKTYLAAFAAKDIGASSVLFVAHRIELLKSAHRTFRQVFEDGSESFSYYVGGKKELAKFTFASMRTLAKDLETISKEHFDFVIIDEFHRAAAPQYERLIAHFHPRFLLGLTATPERTDKVNIYDLVENNVVSNIRLEEALEKELLAPFHYFGISDNTVLELNEISRDEHELVKKLNTNRRIELILKNMKKYQYSGDTLHGLGFCVNKEHAKFMSEQFNSEGIKSICLTGDDQGDRRFEMIERLRNPNDELQFIFTVDIFNEGVDIPELNLILFLRPTESAIVFTQQLGRGLRKSPNKEYVTVLDFVANHRKSYLIPVALMGNRERGYIDKNKVRYMIQSNFKDLNANLHIDLSPIVKEEILQTLDITKFNTADNIKSIFKDFDKVVKESTGSNRTVQILDFVKFENAPEIKQLLSGTVYKNIHTIKQRTELADSIDSAIFKSSVLTKLFDSISSLIPIRKFYDYIALVILLKENEVSLELVQNYVEYVYSIKIAEKEQASIRFAINRLMDNKLLKRSFQDDNGTIHLDQELSSMIMADEFKELLNDYLDYGVHSYEKEFGQKTLLLDEKLQLYKKYKKEDVAILEGVDKYQSAMDQEGVHFYNNCFYLYVNLNKEKVEAHLEYNDYFIDKSQFHWQSQNNTSETSPRGEQFINHQTLGIKVKLFVRKKAKEDGVTEPFIYLGGVDFVSSNGNKPMNVIWRFHQPVPQQLYGELTY
ncbi:DUF3427 domain-containing protein [Listeria sp. SHR_NRA_18]|uniref:DUF3427 domain-containing protein n=1 Tax=Listeria sp. SHR_NRA_18 TaxID=2269046 RepID=UPI00051D6FF7|nr:DUF3427 domain-containing protein [Listeria sp. SHR_NRA_18]KGL42337.1 hypothetical protein EP56_08970 [Listeriaceae bacterium FSL A5-0209]RQW66538.1 DUF3427 domain-containing protein [Listeria sp. SHR_NRA_18]